MNIIMNYFFIQTREQNNFFRIRFNDNHLQDKPVTSNLSCLGKQSHDLQLIVTNYIHIYLINIVMQLNSYLYPFMYIYFNDLCCENE